MNGRPLFSAVAALAACTCIALTLAGLFQGTAWLTMPAPGLPGLPLGNLATWLSLVALAWLALQAAGNGVLRNAALGLLVLAASWLPISALIAGNWLLSFRSSAGFQAWAVLTAMLVLSSVSILAVGGVIRLVRGYGQRR